ncbi:MAG: hypothetical protein ABJF10_11375 [Chthoniobacter sp.]|uniref:hypothetical protein n=1 Tax=Chthoniobacter sp. TaxID=2510640 RepID=UPI0032A99346
MKCLPLFLALACGIIPATRAEDAAPAERIRQGEARQQQLRGEAQKLVDQLDSMLDEYQRNALGGEDTKTLQTLRNSLAKLSVDEMKQVVDLLERARAATNAGEAKQRVADAYSSQKAILTQMSKLLAQHQRDQQSAEIAQQLALLAERQAVNLQNGITLGQWTDGKKPENFEAAMQANLQGQQAEQAAIAEELKVLAQRVTAFARDPDNGNDAARFRQGMEAIQKVQPNVDTAAAALKEGQLFKAVGDEKTARDAMRRLAKDIAPPLERSEALRAAQKELTKVIEDQKEVAKDTAKAAGETDFDRFAEEQKKVNPKLARLTREQLRKDAHLQAQFNAQKNGRPDQLAEQENKQGEVAARSDEIAQNLAKTVPEGAQDVKEATEKMQEARGAMSDKKGAAAAKNTQQALAAMQKAEAKLQQELAKAEALAGKSGDPVKDLQALQQQAQALAQQQAEAAKNPDKAAQPALAEKVKELAKQAAAMAPAAAPAAQQAAANAQKAAQAAQAGQPAAAAPAQQAAAQDLAQAAQQIAQQAAAAQKAQQQAIDAQQAEKQLAEIIIEQQKLQVDTAKGALLSEKRKATKSTDFKGQPERQEGIANQTATFAQSLPPDAPAVNSALDAAQSAMSDAKTALQKPDVQVAKFGEALALEKLYAAQEALQAVIAQAQQPNAPPNAAAQQAVAAQLAQAQEQIAQANEALQQAQQPGQPVAAQQQAAQKAAAELAKASAQAGQAAAQVMPPNGAAQQAAQNGAQAAAQAAAAAAAQNLPEAQAKAQAAQQALAQAQATLAQSQAGLAAANGNSSMPASTGSPSPGKPGSQPGKTPGKSSGPPGTEGAQEYQPPTGNETVQVETRNIAARKSAFTALPARERAVIEQAQAEKYPEEYGAQVEQYLLNLARESAAKK